MSGFILVLTVNQVSCLHIQRHGKPLKRIQTYRIEKGLHSIIVFNHSGVFHQKKKHPYLQLTHLWRWNSFEVTFIQDQSVIAYSWMTSQRQNYKPEHLKKSYLYPPVTHWGFGWTSQKNRSSANHGTGQRFKGRISPGMSERQVDSTGKTELKWSRMLLNLPFEQNDSCQPIWLKETVIIVKDWWLLDQPHL